MIHVCRVDIGCRYVFDMVADNIDDVATLKSAIEKNNGINVNDQVLLISGGEVLKLNNRQKLFGLGAGIEESPIYLLDLNNIRNPNNVMFDVANQLSHHCTDMSKDIDAAISMQPSYQTLQVRTQLAFDVYERSTQMSKLCEDYYYDQFWQYQGYLAVIANLDEYLISFRMDFDKTKEKHMSFLNKKNEYFGILNQIEEYIELLRTSRLLPQIRDNAHNVQLFNSFCSQTKLTSSLISPRGPLSPLNPDPLLFDQDHQNLENLYEWTNSTDPRHKLEIILSKAKESMSTLNDNGLWTEIERDFVGISDESDDKQIKEIKGLTDRLCYLSGFLDECKVCLATLKEVADSFKLNQASAKKYKDETILLDLCNSHRDHLNILKSSHLQILDQTQKIVRSKKELIKVIITCLNIVMNIQTRIDKSHLKLCMYTEQIKNINRYLKQIEQLKNAPQMYVFALNETMRRERFSNVYKTFSKYVHQISNDLCKIETENRAKFHKVFSQNYVANLFPYLQEKKPIEFTKPDLNLSYDVNMPQLNEHDIKAIQVELNQYLNEKNLGQLQQQPDGCDFNEQEQFYLKVIEIMNKILTKNFEAFQKAETSELYLSDEQIIQRSTDNIVTNDDLILVNTKPSANSEFLKKMNEILNGKIKDLKDCLKFKAHLNEFNFNLTQLRDTFQTLVRKQNEEKDFVYTNILENLFSTKSSQFSYGGKNVVNKDEERFENLLKVNKLDEEFYSNLKENLLKLRQIYEKSIDETRKSIETYKKSMNADKQRHFNEAIQKVVNDKEKLETEFNAKEENYLKQLKEKDEKIAQLTSLLDAKEETIQRQMRRDERYTDKVHYLEKQLNKMILSSSLTAAAAAIPGPSPPQVQQSMFSDSVNGSFINVTSSPSCTNVKNACGKTDEPSVIELNSCYVGDLVIAVYDNAHNAYQIVNKSSAYKHFIHTDSLKPFDNQSREITYGPPSDPLFINVEEKKHHTSPCPSVQIPFANSPMSPICASPPNKLIHASSIETTLEQPPILQQQHSICTNIVNLQSVIGSAASANACSNLANEQPSWFVARVVSKEFCIAKKENNRYKLPANTRFYRVRIEPFKL